MATQTNNEKPDPPVDSDDETSVDPHRLAVVRMPTAFLKWVISQPLPKEDKDKLWLDTLPPGSKDVPPPPPRRKKLPPMTFALLVALVTGGVAAGLALFFLGVFEPTDQEPVPAATEASVPEPEAQAKLPRASEQVDPQAEEPRAPAEAKEKPASEPTPNAPTKRTPLATDPAVEGQPPATKSPSSPSPAEKPAPSSEGTLPFGPK